MVKLLISLLIITQLLFGCLFNSTTMLNTNNKSEESLELLRYYVDANITKISLNEKISDTNDLITIIRSNNYNTNFAFDEKSVTFKNEDKNITLFISDNFLNDLNYFTGVNLGNYSVIVYFSSNVGVWAYDKDSCLYVLDLIDMKNTQFIYRKSSCEIIEVNEDVSLCKLARYCRINGIDIVTNHGGESYINDYSLYREDGIGGTQFIPENMKKQIDVYDSTFNSKKVILFNNATIITDLDIWDNIGETIKYC